MHEYYKTYPEKEVFYHCVGEGSDLENLKTLVRELSLEKYVIFHGTKTGEDLDKVVDECDIVFGSLGFHRTGLTGGSPFKAREYCARVIPEKILMHFTYQVRRVCTWLISLDRPCYLLLQNIRLFLSKL